MFIYLLRICVLNLCSNFIYMFDGVSFELHNVTLLLFNEKSVLNRLPDFIRMFLLWKKKPCVIWINSILAKCFKGADDNFPALCSSTFPLWHSRSLFYIYKHIDYYTAVMHYIGRDQNRDGSKVPASRCESVRLLSAKWDIFCNIHCI